MKGRHALTPLAARVEPLPRSPVGGFVTMDGEQHYRISAYHRMDPFLMSLPSDTDLWMFVASGGGLTAGRVDPEGSLFPYVTVDELHDAHHHTGPLTLIRVARNDAAQVLWEPFSQAGDRDPAVERNLVKNTVGNRLVFEEIDHDLALAFRYTWSGCDEFGWVRTATLENRGTATVRIDLLDGLRNILPSGAPLSLYRQSGNLVDAYKKSEMDPESGLGIFSLTAGITDRAEALEVLRANTVWCCGLDGGRVHLSLRAVAAFRSGRVLTEERVLNGARGNYLVSASLELDPDEYSRWHLVGDTGRDHVQIAELRRRLLNDSNLDEVITGSLRQATKNLRHIVGSADGLQTTGRSESGSHHFANVLFNSMRGGVFSRNHEVPTSDFRTFLEVRNRSVARRHREFLAGLPATIAVSELRAATRETGDAGLERLAHEYLPLYFGRRHGDPSRPWNRFSIHVRDRTGARKLNYEGNWRDIFQNWEALCASFPAFLPNVVAKFVNASTVDGFNPYRISRDGVDWETVSADDPWSNIGYWGDHQIVYLLRLLESMNRFDPAAVGDLLDQEIFSYAEVPYRIRPYEEILRDARVTIDFDSERATRIDDRVAQRGTDGKLLTGSDGSVYHANLLEKLLVPALSKLSNLIPGAGIWMNTQRPEWNDANNALGGGGVSVVTLCYLRRYLVFLARLVEDLPTPALPVSNEVWAWFDRIQATLEDEKDLFGAGDTTPADRKRLMDLLGGAFSTYRETVYAGGFTGKRDLAVARVGDLCRDALVLVDRSIAANRREDGLYHTYNLLEIPDDGSWVGIARLQEMLEGQVAVLSSGILEPREALEVLRRLFASELYRSDQHSFMLYPERELPGFLARNVIPAAKADSIPLLGDLLAAGDSSLVARDAEGVCRFHGCFRSAGDVAAALDQLQGRQEWKARVDRDREAVLDLYEDVFRHKAYTGRSGVMYGYEGLGCIYWHMVAKLLVAVQEYVLCAGRDRSSKSVQEDLARMYLRIRAGIGYEKSVAEYGAFPCDPYSHTPRHGGAKQPGMTGQVKEEILTRMGELGIRIENGTVRFQPELLDATDFLVEPGSFRYFDIDGAARSLPLAAGSLAFTMCQVPVVYELATGDGEIEVELDDGTSTGEPGNLIGSELTADLFARNGRISCIRVGVPRETLGRTTRADG